MSAIPLIVSKGTLSGLWGLSLANEAAYFVNSAPFTLNTTVKTADGGAYDMSKPADRQRMADNNVLHFIKELRHTVDAAGFAKVLMTIGMFTYQAVGKTKASATGLPVGPGDPRVPFSSVLLSAGKAPVLNFLDVHVYHVRSRPCQMLC